MARDDVEFASGKPSKRGETLADNLFRNALKGRSDLGRASMKEESMDPAFYQAADIFDRWLTIHKSDAWVVDVRDGTTLGNVAFSISQGLERQTIWFGVHDRAGDTKYVMTGKQAIRRGRGAEYILVISLVKGVMLEELETKAALNGILHFHEQDRLTEFTNYGDTQSGQQRIIDASGITIPNKTIGRFPSSSVTV